MNKKACDIHKVKLKTASAFVFVVQSLHYTYSLDAA